MRSNNKVSIIIPVFNSQNFLEKSLNSVLNQTYTDIEVFCINDGSTDDSLNILESFADQINIIDQKNQGLASALNAGIDSVTGKWFKWFSPDDIMYPENIENLVKEIKTQPDNTIIYSNWDIIDEKGKKLRSFSESNYNDLDIFNFNIRLLDGQQINVNTTLIPSSIFSTGLRMNTLIDPILVDYDFFLRAGLLHQVKFHLLEKSLIQFRVHEGQLSHKKITESLKNLEKTRDDILSNFDEKTKNNYLKNLKIFRKKKSFSKKLLESGLKLSTALLPNSTTDRMLVFYLNKMRKTR